MSMCCKVFAMLDIGEAGKSLEVSVALNSSLCTVAACEVEG